MADLRTINNLEAALSPNHVTSIRIRVIEAEGSLQDYQDTLEHELQLSNEAIANLKYQGKQDDGITYLDDQDDGSTEYAYHALQKALFSS